MDKLIAGIYIGMLLELIVVQQRGYIAFGGEVFIPIIISVMYGLKQRKEDKDVTENTRV